MFLKLSSLKKSTHTTCTMMIVRKIDNTLMHNKLRTMKTVSLKGNAIGLALIMIGKVLYMETKSSGNE